MAQTFSLSEVFRMAENIERNGYEFYTQAAAAAENDRAKKVYLELAEKEKHHQELFADLRKAFCTRTDIHWVDPDGTAEAYLKAIADNHVFNLNQDVSSLLASIQSAPSVLRMAIGFEKDTIVFFTALKNAVSGEHREKVEVLIKEELDHIQQLQAAIDEL